MKRNISLAKQAKSAIDGSFPAINNRKLIVFRTSIGSVLTSFEEAIKKAMALVKRKRNSFELKTRVQLIMYAMVIIK